ncbi:major capsid protein [Amycolatopsis orientalis]|uniref:Major capsid protein n=1 Tax=Amycolatopsis orientalis TaxID=31958 RepID=A0A193BVJ8_AMYOR|nr:phage major capsid protein [Amycolatopsis orientalis]ANN16247.1 major capsid protein [Amycolatopsis orientalis]
MSFPALAEVEGKLADRRKKLATIFDEAGPEIDLTKVKAVKGTTHDIAAAIRELNSEMEDLGKERDNLVVVQKAADRAKQAPGSGGAEPGAENGDIPSPRREKSIGELFTASDAYKLKQGRIGPEATLDVHLKTLMSTSAGWTPEVTRTGTVVPYATRPIQVADLIPQTETSQSAVQYMEETTFNNAAQETAEGGTYQEAALALTEQSSLVRKIAVFLPVTDEQLEDEPQARGYVENRLPFMIRQRLDSQILVGNGTAPNLRGLLNIAGIQTQAKGADPVPDAVYKGIVKVETIGQAMANAVVFNPTDWQSVRLLRTADGLYIWGNPSDAGPERIWGLQVVRAQANPAGAAVVGDYQNFIELAVRRGIDVQVSNSHSTYFVEGKQAIRADIRAALVVYRPAAFCTVTGL